MMKMISIHKTRSFVISTSAKRCYALIIICLTALGFGLSSCKKDWLEKKRDVKLVVPATLEDFAMLLQNESAIAKDNLDWGEVSADDYYVPESYIGILANSEINAYTWQKQIYPTEPSVPNWDNAYKQIFTANVVLEGVEKVEKSTSNLNKWNAIKGTALYLRGRALFNLTQLFAQPYEASTAGTALGVPIDNSAEVQNELERNTVQENYDQILSDLTSAVPLLPQKSEFITDATSVAANGMLARVYLVMGNYERAEYHADQCLSVNNSLMNFNTLSPTPAFPIPRYNVETIQYLETDRTFIAFISVFTRVPQELSNLYDVNDLRSNIYFVDAGSGELGTRYFRGTYSGKYELFTGLATDEMFLIRAESRARQNKIQAAMSDLNTLLVTRWKTGTFVPFTAGTSKEALDIILVERRKELLRRGLRWSDLRRLNLEPGRETTLKRKLNGQEYTLEPRSLRYVLPIPDYVIPLAGLQQNPR